MRILFIGDIVGAPGLTAVRAAVPYLRRTESVDVVIANAENCSNGTGLTPADYRALRAAGVEAVTLGDHVYKKFDIAKVLSDPSQPIVKPANFPASAPGRDFTIIAGPNGIAVGVVSLLGRTFMRAVDCPFAAADRVLDQIRQSASVIVVDVHAEATADKYLLARHLDGRVSAVLGTHTHVPTADEQILPHGTAFVCDVGMTGPYDGILGRRADRILHTAITFEPSAFDVATDDVRLGGALVDVDVATGRATAIRRLQLRLCDIPSA